MNFWDKITGNDMAREMESFDVRVQSLPQDYRQAWAEISRNLWDYTDFTGRALMPVLDGVVGLLEETAAEGQDVTEVLGDDIDGFCASLAGEEGLHSYRDKCRMQLNETIAKKLNRKEKVL